MPSPEPVDPRSTDRTPVRHYHVGELIAIMVSFVLTGLVLEPDGLLTWAERMPVGRARAMWIAVLEPMDRAFDSRGIPRPRQSVIAFGDGLEAVLQHPLGRSEDDAPDSDPEPLPGADPVPAEDPSGRIVPGLGLAMGYAIPDALPEAAEVGDGGSSDFDGGEFCTAAPDDGRLATGLEPLSAAAGDAGDSSPRAAATTVLLVGDSMMKTGLSGAIKRALAKDPAIRIVRANQEATGLSRPDVFDWAAVLRPLIAQEHPSLVVCTFGANDAQTIRENGHELEFGTWDWDATYRHRAVDMMGLLGSQGATVLWLGLPTMRASEFDGRMKHLNGIFAEIAGGVPHTEFLESASPIACADEPYCTYQRQGQKLVKIRLDDGIHYTPAGGDLVARRIVNWIRDGARINTAHLEPVPSALTARETREPLPNP